MGGGNNREGKVLCIQAQLEKSSWESDIRQRLDSECSPSKPFMSATFSLPMMEVYQKQSPSELSAEHSSSRKPSLTCTPPTQSRLSLSHSPLDSR